jgi:DNA polymerase delta subunit 1
MHYLYVAAPSSFQQSDCEPFKAYLETHLAQHQPAIYSVQMLLRENLYGFQGNVKSPYLKITVTDPKYINKLRTSIESGSANYKGLWKGADGGVLTFDNIQYVLRFMIDTKVRRSCRNLSAETYQTCSLTNTGLRNVLGRDSSIEIHLGPRS